MKDITKTCPCNILHFPKLSKLKFSYQIFYIYIYFLSSLKTLIVEAVLTNTHNLCFRAKIRKIGIPLHAQVLLYKIEV